MLSVRTTANTRGLDAADQIAKQVPGLLRETLETQSRPKVEAIVQEEALLGKPHQADFFTFGSRKSQRFYFHLLYAGAIPFIELAKGKRIFARQDILENSWRVRFDARSRGKDGGLLTIENRAQDRQGRHFPAFVLPRAPGSLSQYRQQPGFFGRWNFPFAFVTQKAKAIMSSDILKVFKERFGR